jgi:protocatechuate 3,4-dioxygenase beta subunit
MRMRSLVAVAVGVLALGAVLALVHFRPQVADVPAPTAPTASRTLPGPSVPTPPPRGALSIRGRVVDAQGNPAAGVEVSATRVMPGESLSQLPCDDASPELTLSSPECSGAATEVLMELIEVERGGAPVLARATSAADGAFQLDALPEGTVALWALGARGSAMKPGVAAGSDGVELVLEKGVSLPGRVVDDSGAPLAGAKVTLFDHEGSRYFELRTGADGRFAFGPLPDVPYGLVASSPGLLPVYLPEVLEEELEEDLVLHLPRRLVGKVLAGDRSVAGAQVRVEGTSHVTTTDAEGRFTFEPLPPGEYAVLGEHAGQYGVANVRIDTSAETETTVHLGTLFFAEGTVRDEAGSPVAGASVSALARGDMRSLPPATTSAEGRFRLGPLPAGPTRFFVEAEQYLDLESEDIDLSPSGAPLDFTLTRAFTLDGIVTDTEGQPLEGVELDAELKTPGPPAPEVDSEEVLFAMSDATDSFFASSNGAGRFRLKVATPGRYVVTASVGDHVPVRLEVDAPATGLHLALRAGGSVKGSVVDARGEPLSSVDLRVTLGTGSTAQELTTESDDEGSFLLEGLPPGTHTLEATLELAGARHQASRTVEVRGPGTVEASLRMDTGGSVSGLVVDEQGRPIPDAEVEAYVFFEESNEFPGMGTPSSAKTGPDGGFTVHHLRKGPCLLRASKPGYSPAEEDLEQRPPSEQRLPSDFQALAPTGARDVRLVLRYQGSISGRVVRADGASLTGLSVSVNYNNEHEPEEDGTFRVPVAAPGQQQVLIHASGLAPVLREVEVALGQDVDLGEVRLETGRRVSGRLVDAETSAPVVGVQVQVEEPDAPPGRTQVLAGEATALDGTFAFPSLEARPLKLVVRHKGYLPLLQRLGTGDETLELRLSRGARVEGTVRDRAGRPVETTVRLTPLSREAREPSHLDSLPDMHRFLMMDSRAMMHMDDQSLRFTSTGGTFSTRGLKPGAYALETEDTRDAGGREVRFPPQRVHIPASGTVVLAVTELSGGATLRAIMNRLELEEPTRHIRYGLIPGSVPASETYEELRLRLRAEGLPSTFDSPSRSQVYEHLPAGRYTLLLVVMTESERYLAWTEELDLPSAGTVTRDVRPVLRPVAATR